MARPRITLDQWSTLVAVVEASGYAQASERLHPTQSTVTYTIQKLENLLGIKAFAIQGRKAVLTEAGAVLYRRGKSLVENAARLERAATELAKGWEPQPVVHKGFGKGSVGRMRGKLWNLNHSAWPSLKL